MDQILQFFQTMFAFDNALFSQNGGNFVVPSKVVGRHIIFCMYHVGFGFKGGVRVILSLHSHL